MDFVRILAGTFRTGRNGDDGFRVVR